MVIVTQARHLRLSPPPTTTVSAIIYDPTSLCLALKHSDSSFSLYPNISPFSQPSATTTASAVVVSPPSSDATFLRLRTTDTSRVIFVVSSPHLAGNEILLRFYNVRTDNKFTRVRVCCNQSDLSYDERKLGVLFKVKHGVSIKLVGSTNVFAMYSVSARKVWVFAVKIVGDDIKLMKTAVIDCNLPVFSISVSVEFLILGEENGVRVFNLRPLVKGKLIKKSDNLKLQKMNGTISQTNGKSILLLKPGKTSGISSKLINVNANSAKLKTLKMIQNSNEDGVRFVAFKSAEFEDPNSSKGPWMSIKAISIHFLANNKFLILDSVGDLYLLLLSNPISGSVSTCEMKKLNLTMKVQIVAVHPDDSTRAKTVWVSDGEYTIYAIIVSDADSTTNENDTEDIAEKIQSSASEVIFTSEKIQQIIPLAANAILLLGQGRLSSIKC
ncbi:uncharacterized protein [Rutidosis leptorrhynchoides]|uniref:uncharacterized protein isoform X2 n=1 Tax=Rutidosis leptorrhynchoides TaxID=125765 RepID=UPI003A996D19